MSAARAFSTLVLCSLLAMGATCGSLGLTPGSGTFFTTPQTVLLEANVESPRAGEVTSVQFMRDGVTHCSDPQPPYECAWSITAADNGVHHWKAMAHIQNGNLLEGASVDLFVNIEETADTDLGEPQLVGFLAGLGAPLDVAVNGSELFVASEQFGLSQVDASQPGLPSLVGSAAEPFPGVVTTAGTSLALVGGWTTEGNAAITVVDVGNPDRPLLGSLDSGIPTSVLDLALDSTETLAVAAMGSAGLWVIGFDALGRPVLRGTYDTPGWAYGVVLDAGGTTAYVADGLGGLQIIDVSDPERPSLAGSKLLGGVMRDVAISGSIAYLASQSASLRVLDVSDPGNPVSLGGKALSGIGSRILIDGSRIAVLSANNPNDLVDVFDAANPASPVLVHSFAVGAAASVISFTMSGDYIYVAASDQGLKVYALSGSTASYVSTLQDSFDASTVVRNGDVGLVGGEDKSNGMAALFSVNIDADGRPTLAGSLSTDVVASGGFLDLALNAAGTRAVAAMGGEGIWVIKVNPGGNPVVLGTYDTPGWAYGVELDSSGTVAYVADGFGGLQILSLANPRQPSFLGSKSVGAMALDVAVDGDLVYLASQSGTMRVLDVSNPASIRTAGYALLSGVGRKIVREGDRVAVLSGNGSDLLDLFDVSDPSKPVLASTTSIGAAATIGDIALRGDTLFVAAEGDGLELYDITATGSLGAPTQVTLFGDARGVAVNGGGTEISVADSSAVLDIVRR